jgi:hypothetical protein
VLRAEHGALPHATPGGKLAAILARFFLDPLVDESAGFVTYVGKPLLQRRPQKVVGMKRRNTLRQRALAGGGLDGEGGGMPDCDPE